MSRHRQFGSEPDGGFNAASRAFKATPTIETYLDLRRSDPAAEIEVAVTGGFEAMFYMREEFEKFGLDPDLLGGLLDAAPEAVDAIALRLLQAIVDSRHLAGTGETHLASRERVVPHKLIDWIIVCILDAMSWNDDLTISRDLIVLIRERLGGPASHYEEVGRIRQSRQNAAILAGQLKARGISPTLAILGEAFGVSPSTVKRWFAPGELEQEGDRWSRMFDDCGQLCPLSASDVASKI
ncbi:hypothetical protein [Caulobacter endophyticus]|uniref:hypothetical protein n=1 Tax=Caulobacter endophyticus TaxID=2172652 RepID=UPI00240ED267|nr:hypothetical protein [Caulobacter endophyticus]MDG2527563.1 hypothetical protein [Caulobacter endophyticus]